jgi:hypothetical protein
MKRTALLILAAALAVPAMAAQEAPRRDMDGRTGLVFDFNGLNLSGFEGGAGVKTWLSKSLALVGGLEYYRNRNHADPVATYSSYETISSDYGLFVAFEHHLKPGGAVSPFWGLSLGFGGGTMESSYFPAPEYGGDSTRNTENRLHLEPRLNLGLELHLGDHVSLSGCYQFGLNYQWGTSRSESVDPYTQTTTAVEQKTSRTTWSLGSSSLRVTVYF